MKTVSLVVLGLAVFVLIGSGLVFASCGMCGQDAAAASAGTAGKSEAVDAGNKICPVSGDPIDAAAKVTYEYEGNIYNLCCADCIEPFKKEPQKYIDKVNQELQDIQSAK